jgi:preprotein translocase subunit SecE
MKQKTAIAKNTPSRVRFTFFRETVSELRKVVWLSRRETIYLTTLVLAVSAVMAVILGSLDWVFSQIVHNVFMVN